MGTISLMLLAFGAHLHHQQFSDARLLREIVAKNNAVLVVRGHAHETTSMISVEGADSAYAWHVTAAPDWFPSRPERLRRFLFTRIGTVTFHGETSH